MAALSPADTAHVLLAFAVALLAAHGLGYAFSRLGLPRVLGEISAGLVLGPTVLGAIWPSAQRFLFGAAPAVGTVLGAMYELGVLLLMFCSGLELRATAAPGERRAVVSITLVGSVVPFALGLFALQVFDPAPLVGPAQDRGAFLLVFGIAIAVTSIPVLSRILHDLGSLSTPFARVALTAAVLEDLLLYVVLSVALGLVGRAHGQLFGLPASLGVHGTAWVGATYHVAATLLFCGVALAVGPRLFDRGAGARWNVIRRSSPVGALLIFLLGMTALAAALGVAPMFGAFLAGVVAQRRREDATTSRETLQGFAFGVFVPLYFALVGMRLDLSRDLDVPFFAAFLAFACAAKAVSVYAGARLGGESNRAAVNLAVGLNARGGPGIVLAAVAHDARIISDRFFASLVLLALATSLLAGAWLARVVRSGAPLR